MIKPNELRLGNYVYLDIPTLRNDEFFVDKVTVTVKAIAEDRADIQYENHSREILILDKLIPIPLDESWLLRFGLTVNYGSKFWGAEIKNTFVDIEEGIYIAKTQYGWRFAIMMDDSAHFEYPTIPDIKYVHQLQNLYFALTGEELELKYASCNTCTNYYNPKTISKCPVCNPLIVKNDSEPPMMGMSY